MFYNDVVAPRSRSRPPSTSAGSTADGNGSATRQRLIEAALDAIHAYGYRQASSNKIAEHAGVTWGVIQYHFGTRERLLFAVLQNSIDKVERHIDAMDGKLPGATIDERLDAWQALVLDSFGYQLFPAIVQIVLDLGRDPSVADDTIAELNRWQSTIRRLTDLAAQLGGQRQLPSDLAGYIYWSSWSVELAESMHTYLTDTEDRQAAPRRQALRVATKALVAHAARHRKPE
jgi:AcrR family transcriptional regulator